MENKITLKKNNTTYNITIKLVSELIVFHIETSDFPKKIYESSFSDSDIKSKHKSFSLYEDIKSNFELLKSSIKEPSEIIIDEKENFIVLQIPSPLKDLPLKDLSPTMTFEIVEKNDINYKISELYSLYKDLKSEKDNEIKDLLQKNTKYEETFEQMNKEIEELIQKNTENEETIEKMNNEIKDLIKKNKDYKENFEKMNKEINNLKGEIKKLKEEFKKDKTDLENFISLNRTQNRNIEKKLEKLEEKTTDNTNKVNDLEKNYSSLQNQIFILTFNNLGNFKSPFEEYYNKLKKNSTSVLFGEYFKPSYDIIVEIIFENMKRDKEKDNNKVIESSESKKYELYNGSEWNWFLINNVIYQMIFCDIKLNEEGVDETVENIFKFRPDFEKYKFDIKLAIFDIKNYVKDFKLGQILEGLKGFKKLNLNLLPK